MKALQPLLLAMTLLTSVPVGRLVRTPISAADQGRSVAGYPLVGLFIGAILVLVHWLLGDVPAPLNAILLVVTWVVLTGALHLDALADCTDAWAAGHADPTRTLAVMKDPACGPMAVTALILLLLLKFGALATLTTLAPAVLLAAPVLGRSAAVLLMTSTNYRRANGIATTLSAQLRTGPALMIVAVLAVAGLFILPPGLWALLLVASGLCVWLWRRMWRQRIDGYTGDVAGGLIECVEVVVLLVAVFMQTA